MSLILVSFNFNFKYHASYKSEASVLSGSEASAHESTVSYSTQYVSDMSGCWFIFLTDSIISVNAIYVVHKYVHIQSVLYSVALFQTQV